MRNTDLKVKDKILTITIDLGRTLGPSKSGKTILIASTDGNVAVPGAPEAMFLGLNLYKPK